ncbi:phage integrase SAM-like domain-containing protein [Limibacter armeniacum]|uniref:site-specific integrase n=1 Tax=Limibacter armeniacum TaxID=466084 RepID=UPI002FE52E68
MINFYLKNVGRGKTSSIALYISINGKRIFFGTGHSCKPADWLKKRQRTRNNEEINARLSRMETEVIQYFRKQEGKALPMEEAKEHIRELIRMVNGKVILQEDHHMQFWDAWNEFLRIKQVEVSAARMKKLRSTEKHMRAFEQGHLKFKFNRLDSKLFELITAFLLIDQNLTNNSASSYIATFKTFLNWTRKHEYHNSSAFEDWHIKQEQADTFALTEQELERIIQLQLPDRLSRVRDLFVFLCHTGQRFGDTQKELDIRDGRFWYNVQGKGRKTFPVVIPLSPTALSILKKYNNALPKISNQKANEYLKEIGQLAGMDASFTVIRYQGSRKLEQKQPRWQLLGTHTGRRTFTTLSLARGMNPEMVKAVTGHSDQRSFQKYVRLVDSQKREAGSHGAVLG